MSDGLDPAGAWRDGLPPPCASGAAAKHHHPDRHAMICEAAYRLAERRGFAPGCELDDWLAAEAEVDQRLFGEGRVF